MRAEKELVPPIPLLLRDRFLWLAGKASVARQRGHGGDHGIELFVVPKFGEVKANGGWLSPGAGFHLGDEPVSSAVAGFDELGLGVFISFSDPGECLEGEGGFLDRRLAALESAPGTIVPLHFEQGILGASHA